ncbi:hypothetical protein ACAX43_27070 [Paraburkholderia sp. IW21]|uniref:hypothetical protein n=1 Tax=Paraburkholderia sp. IW21 TaxID=3242488 RepID=UPI00351FBC8A
MNTVKTDIEQIEKALKALVRLPQLIRRDYWISRIDCLLIHPKLSAQDRNRLSALVELLGTTVAECDVPVSQ